MRLRERVRAATGPGARTVRSVLVSVFLLDVLTALIVIGFGNAYLVRTLHEPPSYPAFALAVYGVTKLVMAAPGGWLVERASGVVAAACVVGLEAGGVTLMLVMGSGEGYIAGVAPLSAGSTLGWLLVLRALGAAVAPDGRGAASAYLGLVATAGLGTGLGLAALLAELPEPRVTFAVGLAVAACSVLPLLGTRLGPARHAVRDSGPHPAPGRRELAAALVLFAHFGTIGSVAVTFGPFALGALGLTLLQLAVLLTPAAAASALGMLVAGRRSRHTARLREAAPVYALAAAATLFCAATTDARWFALGAVPLGAAVGATIPLVNAARIDVSRGGGAPGAVLARLSVAEGLGGGLVPLAVGLAIHIGGERAGMVAVAVGFALIATLTAAGARIARL